MGKQELKHTALSWLNIFPSQASLGCTTQAPILICLSAFTPGQPGLSAVVQLGGSRSLALAWCHRQKHRAWADMSWLLVEIPQINLSCFPAIWEEHDEESAESQNGQHESVKIIHHSSAPQQAILLSMQAQICHPDSPRHITAGWAQRGRMSQRPASQEDRIWWDIPPKALHTYLS